jgi:predicted nucleic acid-binding protein
MLRFADTAKTMWYLGKALAGQAVCIVTGDRDLLVL